MEIKKLRLGEAAADAGKNAKAFFAKTKDTIVTAADRNGDGTFNLKDVTTLAEAIGNAAQNTANAVKDTAEAKSREKELRLLQPIFPEDRDGADFTLSKLIRVAEMDKKHAESPLCQGSVGFLSQQKELRIVNIYKDAVGSFGLTLFPDAESEIYYVDPSDRNKYIALDDYFSFLKVARINELQRIAQDLGATHFRVTYREETATTAKKEAKGGGNAKLLGGKQTADAQYNVSTSDHTNIQVAAELQCRGHAPIEPKLVYLRGEPSIQSLGALRMDKDSQILHQEFSLKRSNSSGIREKDAIKIDAALKAMKISGHGGLVSEVQKESRRFFEYEVDF